MDNTRQHEAAVAILKTAEVLRRRLAVVIEPHDITLQQYNVLRVIRSAGGQPIPTLEIGAQLVEHAPGITRLLDRLDEKGLIRRERGAGDRRLVHCWITPSGLSLLAGLDDRMNAIDTASFDGFDPDEVDALLEMLEAVRIAQ